MPEPFNVDKLLDGGPNGNIDDKLRVEVPVDPRGDKPVDTELFDRVMSGEKIIKEDIEKSDKEIDKKEAKDEGDKVVKLPKTEEEKLKAEEEESARKLEEKQKKAEEEESKKEAEKDDKDKAEDASKPKLPPTAKLPTADQKVAQEDAKTIEATIKELGLPDTAASFFKKMDKSARDYVVAEFRRNKSELETTKASLETAKKSVRNDIPANWYEHKQAYALTPEFQKATATANQMKSYAEHFREQLISIEQGEDWIDLVMDDQGRIQNVPRKTTSDTAVRAKYDLMSRVQAFEEAASNNSRKAQQIAGQFIQYHQTLKEDIRSKEDEWFPQYKDDKEFESNQWGKYAKTMLDANGQGNNPIAGLYAKLYAFAIETQEENQRLKSAGKSNIPPVNNNGPTGDEIDKGAGEDSAKKKLLTTDDSPFSEDEFEKLKTRGQLV